MKRLMRWLAWLLPALLLLAASALAFAYFWRPGMTQYAAHAYRAPAARAALRATWFGTTAVLLDDGRQRLFIDPFFTRPPGFVGLLLNRRIAPDEALIRRWLQQAGIERLDAVLVSHTHYDHAMDAGVVARLTGATLIGSASTVNVGRGAALPPAQLHEIADGEGLSIGDFTLQFIRSRHAGATGGAPTGAIEQPLRPPARYLDYRQGGSYSILIGHPQGRVLHHGSAGYVPGALSGRQADLVFLGVALIDDLPAYLREVVDAVGARRIVPTHWDDFTRPLQQPLLPFPVAVRLDRFFEQMEQRPDLRVETLWPAEPVVLFGE